MKTLNDGHNLSPKTSRLANIETAGVPVKQTPGWRNFTLRGFFYKNLHIKYEPVRLFLGELMAEMIYITVGLSSIAQFKLAEVYLPILADPLALYFGYSVGAMFAVLICGKVSGPNLTTAISFGRLVAGDISIFRFLIYAGAQFLGAFMGSLWVWIIFLEAIKKHPKGFHSITTASIFSTYPTGDLSYVEEFFMQVIASCLCVMVYFALTDKRNTPVSHGFACLFVGFIIMMKTCAFTLTLSNSINPARDFAPRLFTCIAGWGGQVFSYGDYWFWIPLVSPLVGATLGTLLYLGVISSQLEPAESEDQTHF